jgi:hypothetical protein
MRLVELVDRVLQRDLFAFLGVGSKSRTTIVQVRGQNCFQAMYHEEGREARGMTRCGT